MDRLGKPPLRAAVGACLSPAAPPKHVPQTFFYIKIGLACFMCSLQRKKTLRHSQPPKLENTVGSENARLLFFDAQEEHTKTYTSDFNWPVTIFAANK